MKPLKLMMQAFGPYAEKEIIDFTKLGNRKMFVISGKTGAGKTTIFDGISFAIYGKASGEDRNGSDLRSQFAADDLLTEVSLQFSLRNKTYYIWRSPQQDKKKARGDGFTTVSAKAELYIYDEEGNKKLIASNVREADEKIKEIIQLDSNQFRQILMIPQGEFRKLLTSDSKEKEAILQRLFHTELFKKIEEHLKEEATVLKRFVEGKMEERSHALKSIYTSDNSELKLAIEEDLINDVNVMKLLKEELIHMQQITTELNGKLEKQKEERDIAKKKVDEAEALLAQFDHLIKLKAQQEELISKRDYYELKKKEIDEAYKASRIEQQDELCHRLKKEMDSYQKNYVSSKQQLEDLQTSLEYAQKKLEHEESKSNLRQQVADHLITITNLQEEVYTLEDRQQELHKLQNKLMEVDSKIQKTKQEISDIEAKVEKRTNDLKQLEHYKIEMLESEKEIEQLSYNVQKLKKLETLQQKWKKESILLSEKEPLYKNVISRLEDSKKTLQVIEHRWQKGQAQALAQTLITGNPCPVCGSTHHPQIALGSDEIPSEEDLKSAKLQIEKLEKEKYNYEKNIVETKSVLLHLKESIDEYTRELKMDLSTFSLENTTVIVLEQEKLLHEMKQVNIDKKRKISNLQLINDEIKLLNEKIHNARKDLDNYINEEKSTSQLFTEKKTQVQASLNNIPEELRSKEAYDQKVIQLKLQKQELEKAYEHAQQQVNELKEKISGCRAKNEQLKDLVIKSENTLKEEREKFVHMLQEEGFNGYKHFALAKKSMDKIKQLEQEVQNYREEYRSVSDRLLELSERLKNTEKPQINILNETFTTLEKELLELNTELTNVMMNIRLNKEIVDKVETINESIKDAEEKYKLIGHLSDIAKGQNTYRITFERFVLAAFLDDILTVANIRLTRMTSGRYHLLRKTDRSKGNVQSGLELLVFDQYTGQERHVKTLSGGESFKASLALALGLADVVQQYAGGVSLETMFIDEGFGTLDPESLDQAIEALMDIQNSGRLVGLISHVPELKERIDARLEVFSSQNGSKTEFQFFT
ncbi:SbcC/MukB-like Walker B domain-containing protein [Heyndrickxia oleronia]|uniref:SbcC/MukB-like Walker B domain-containing protein n=1 Tax=Heyndrickxia oleronia TaxID=38875 RepID=UPI001AFCE92E|nr:SbcC/MukB-like Walker B domain-containing protein [Heyndrickxia oleronia]GIN37380.1 nuclease SbcCD subunit C [Heyndrickxia oleronia]